MTLRRNTLIIDCQAFQTATWHRGIGKYSMEFLAHTRPSLPYEQVVLLFNAALPIDDEVREIIANRVHDVRILEVELQTIAEGDLPDTVRVQEENTRHLDRLLTAEGLVGADFFILAAFLGAGPCAVYPTNAGRRFLLFYDIIPLLYHANYLGTPKLRAYYLPRYRTVFEADLILTISQSVADDLAVYLGIPERRTVNISGAAIGRQGWEPKAPAWAEGQRFVLFPTGQDYRKNNPRAMRAFTQLLANTHLPLKLVVTSTFQSSAISALRKLCGEAIFAGNVSEAEMAWLYANAEAVLFASESEGLGLPVLEGVEADKPVVCSDIAPFREMSTEAFYYFDPFDESAMADALERALVTDTAAFTEKRAQYAEVLDRFSWKVVAAKVCAALQAAPAASTQVREKPRMAVLGPDPVGHSAVGKVMQELHPALAEHYEVDYFFDLPSWSRKVRPNYLSEVARTAPARRFSRRKYDTYDSVVYHLGNSAFHLHTAKSALHLPGHAILHDTDLYYLFDALLQSKIITPQRLAAEHALQDRLGVTKSNYLASLANRQHSVIVHSQFAKDAVDEVTRSRVPCHALQLPVGTPRVRRHTARADVRIGLAGILAPVKGLDVVRRLALDPRFQHVRFEVFGHGKENHPNLLAMEALPNVAVLTNLTDFEYQQRLANIDILVNYRSAYRGETSLTVLEAMRYATANIVRGGMGWFEELPDDAVAKVRSEDDLSDRLAALVADSAARDSIGYRGQELVRASHSHEQYAQTLVEIVRNVPSSRSRSDGAPASASASRPTPAVALSTHVRRAARSSAHVGVRAIRRLARGDRGPGEVTSHTEPVVVRPWKSPAHSAFDASPDATSVASLRVSVPADVRRGASSVRRSRVTARADFDAAWLNDWTAYLGENWGVHRKLWEYCEILQAAKDADCLRPGLSACGFGVGEEPIPAALASLGLNVTAVDGPADGSRHGWWVPGRKVADLTNCARTFVDPEVLSRQLKFVAFDVRESLAALGRHHLVWSSSVVPHLGSPTKGLDFVRRSLDLLEPGGVAVHMTELELLPREGSADYGNHSIYTPEHLRRFFRKLQPGFSFDVSFHIPLGTPEDCHIDLPPYPATTPHLKLLLGESVTTSFVITIRRDFDDQEQERG